MSALPSPEVGGGARSSLADKGVTLDLRYTSFYQGLVSGTGKQDFNYGGKVDAFINFDSGKMGLWEGGGFRSHVEFKHNLQEDSQQPDAA